MLTNRTLLLTTVILAGAATASFILTPRARRTVDASWLRTQLDRAQEGLATAEEQVAEAGAEFESRLRDSGVSVDWSIASEEVARDLPRMPHA